MKKLVALFACLALSACTGGVVGTTESYEGADGAFTIWNEGERLDAVNASGTTFDGQEISLEDYRGKVVLINTWYASCPPCRAEAEDLAAIAADYPDVVMIGVNTRDAAGAAEAFDRTFKIPYASVEGKDGRFISGLEGTVPLQAVPTTLILDPDGRPAARYLGQIDPTIVRGFLDDAGAK